MSRSGYRHRVFLRWYAERTPEFRDAAAEAGAEIADAASVIDGMRGFDRLDAKLRAQLQAWGEEGRPIATAFGRGNAQGAAESEDGRRAWARHSPSQASKRALIRS